MVDIPEVQDAELAFGSRDINLLIPAWDDLPEEYRSGWTGEAPGCKLASDLFHHGGRLPEPKDGVDIVKASRVIRACLCSFEPKHEHKIAGVGYLLNQWFKL